MSARDSLCECGYPHEDYCGDAEICGRHVQILDEQEATAFASKHSPVAGEPGGAAIPLGPSEDYRRLLRGEITAEEYVRRVKAEVRRGLKRGN